MNSNSFDLASLYNFNPMASFFSAAKAAMGIRETQTVTNTITVNDTKIMVHMTIPASIKKEEVEKIFQDNKSKIENTAAALMFNKKGEVKQNRQVSALINLKDSKMEKIERITPGILWNDKKSYTESDIHRKLSQRNWLHSMGSRTAVKDPEESEKEFEKKLRKKREADQPLHSMGGGVTVEDWDSDDNEYEMKSKNNSQKI